MIQLSACNTILGRFNTIEEVKEYVASHKDGNVYVFPINGDILYIEPYELFVDTIVASSTPFTEI